MDVWQLAIRESVRQTMADYTASTDRFDLPALTQCFTSEGVLVINEGRPMRGRAAIEAGLRGQVSGSNSRLTHVRHHVSSIRFAAVEPERVEVDSYFAVFTDVGVDHWGRYRDEFVPVDQRWLIGRRSIRVDGFARASLMRDLQPGRKTDRAADAGNDVTD